MRPSSESFERFHRFWIPLSDMTALDARDIAWTTDEGNGHDLAAENPTDDGEKQTTTDGRRHTSAHAEDRIATEAI